MTRQDRIRYLRLGRIRDDKTGQNKIFNKTGQNKIFKTGQNKR